MANRRRAKPATRDTEPKRKRRAATAPRHKAPPRTGLALRRGTIGKPAGSTSSRQASLCWRICKWRPLYAVPTEPGSDAERYALMYPMQYVKLWCGQTTAEGIFVDKQLAAIRAAGGQELLGIATQLLRMAACADRFGGRLVDHLGHPASPTEIAVAVGVNARQMQAALRKLSGPRIAFVEQSPCEAVGTPIDARAAARAAHTPNAADERLRPACGGPGEPGTTPGRQVNRDGRQVGGQAPGTARQRGTGVEFTPPVSGLPDACGPPRDGASGAGYADGHADDNPQEQEQEQEKGPEQSAGQESAAPKEKRIGKVGNGQDTQARARARTREGEATSQGTSTSQTTATSQSTGMSQPIADVPIEPTGADPMAKEYAGKVDGGYVDAFVLAMYERLYPDAQFESCEMLKGNNGRGLSARQFRAREQGAIASGLEAAMAGKSEAERSALWAWCISAAEEVYRRDHRKRRHKPLASVWLWRLKRHRNGAARGLAGASGPP